VARGRPAEEEAIARDLDRDDEDSEHPIREGKEILPWGGFGASNYYYYNYLSLGRYC
jgi:hypothetical protein